MSGTDIAMFRSYKSDEEEYSDPNRVTGTVVIERVPCEPHMPDDDNSVQVDHANASAQQVTTHDAHYIKDDRDDKLYYFRNTVHKNPRPGLGSQQRSYLLGVDDAEKKKPYMMLMNVDANACDEAWLGPVLEEGQKVTFVPKRREELVCDEMGDIVLYTQEASYNPPVPTTLMRESTKAGVACDIALDPRVEQQAKPFAPFLPNVWPLRDADVASQNTAAIATNSSCPKWQRNALNLNSPDQKRQRTLFHRDSPSPIPIQWTRPCEEFMLHSESGEGLRIAIEAAMKFSPKKAPHPTAAQQFERVVHHTRQVRNGMQHMVNDLLEQSYERLTTMPPVMYAQSAATLLTAVQQTTLDYIARWLLYMKWYGVGSNEERSMCFYLCQWMSKAAKKVYFSMDSVVVAMCFNLAVVENQRGGGDAVSFADVGARDFLTKSSPLLEDPLCVYALLQTCDDGSLYDYIDYRLRDDTDFNLHLVAMAGDDILCYIEEGDYESSPVSSWLLKARMDHYHRNPLHEPWLRIESTEPDLELESSPRDMDVVV